MANNFGLTKKVNFTQKGRHIDFYGRPIRQNQEVVVSWGPADDAASTESWEVRRRNGQLPPSVKMVFLVDRVTIQCVEITATGGPGFQNVTLETFAEAGNPLELGAEAVWTWTKTYGETNWVVTPKLTGVEHGEAPKAMSRKEYRSVMLAQVRESELVDVARTYAENYPRGSEALREKFGFTESTAHRRRRKAIELGLLPVDGSSKKDYEKVLVQLAKMESPGPQRSNDEVKEILRKMKDGTLND